MATSIKEQEDIVVPYYEKLSDLSNRGLRDSEEHQKTFSELREWQTLFAKELEEELKKSRQLDDEDLKRVMEEAERLAEKYGV